ncbi:hypothetical protein Sjap_005220 [Stephania japonica]|uniref:OTU domain-containing protein n=1 Tax=Stephania japonica TaxID=461633 RepID=A0AAP0K3P2_9MAGN
MFLDSLGASISNCGRSLVYGFLIKDVRLWQHLEGIDQHQIRQHGVVLIEVDSYALSLIVLKGEGPYPPKGEGQADNTGFFISVFSNVFACRNGRGTYHGRRHTARRESTSAWKKLFRSPFPSSAALVKPMVSSSTALISIIPSLQTHPSVEIRPIKVHRTRGFFKDSFVAASKSSHYPTIWNTHVDGIFNVDGDGQCRFWVVAKSLGLFDMDEWRHVRERMAAELTMNTNFWEDIYGIIDFKKLLAIIQCDKDEATVDNWMTLPNMGLIISTSLNVMLVVISNSWSFTFLPLRSKPPPKFSSCTIVGISIVDSIHFIEVRLKSGCPFPKLYPLWDTYEAVGEQGPWDDREEIPVWEPKKSIADFLGFCTQHDEHPGQQEIPVIPKIFLQHLN